VLLRATRFAPKLVDQFVSEIDALRVASRDRWVGTAELATFLTQGENLEEKVKDIYFELFYHAKTPAILDRNQDELQQIQQIAETRYRVGQGLQQDQSNALMRLA
jgi:hypothetical protein